MENCVLDLIYIEIKSRKKMQSENCELFQAKWGERRRHTSFTCETQDSVEKPPNQGLMLNGHWASQTENTEVQGKLQHSS